LPALRVAHFFFGERARQIDLRYEDEAD
jgi:hypothetical protein